MMFCVIRIALVALTISVATAAAAQAPSPIRESGGDVKVLATNGATQSAHVSVQTWAIAGGRVRGGAVQEIPLRGFYIAHLIGGSISTTIDGGTTQHTTGDYWAVKQGATMRVKASGEFAVLETIVVSKQ